MNAALSLFEEDKFDCLANRLLERIKIKRFNCLWEIFKLVDNFAIRERPSDFSMNHYFGIKCISVLQVKI